MIEGILPTAIVTSAIEISSVIKSYAKGEISEFEAFSRLGKDGVGSLAASWGGAVGTFLLPGIGTMVGSMVGYMVSSTIYDSCLQVLREAEIAYENYECIREMCEAARESMRKQRLEFDSQMKEFLINRQKTISESMSIIMDSLDNVETTNFTQALSALANEFGRELQFESLEEFDDFMSDDNNILIF